MEKQISKYASWSFILIILNLLSWFVVLTSFHGIFLLQGLFFILIFIFFPIISIILGMIAFNDIKKNKLGGYKQTLFSIIASIASLALLFVFGTRSLF